MTVDSWPYHADVLILGVPFCGYPRKKKFVCPCHSSEFDIRGEVLDPPATRALDTFRISIENNVVNIDLGKPIKRSSFDLSLIAYPKESEAL